MAKMRKHSYDAITKKFQDEVASTMLNNQAKVVCIRRVNNHSGKKGAFAFEVEYAEKKVRQTTASNAARGVSLGVMLNQDYDDRFNVALNIHRAWTSFTSFEALAMALARKPFTEEEKEELLELEIDADGNKERIIVLQDMKPVEYKDDLFELHVSILEMYADEVENAELTKSQRAGLEHDNAVLQTGGKDSELIVCGSTGREIRRITEARLIPKGESIGAEFDTYIPNKMTLSAYKKRAKATKQEAKDLDEKLKGTDAELEEAFSME